MSALTAFLKTVGNCRGLSLIRSITASIVPCGFAFVPILRVDQFRPRGLSEDNRIHYGQRCSSSACCALVKGSCSFSRLSQNCAISAKRSGGVKRIISLGVSKSMLPAYRIPETHERAVLIRVYPIHPSQRSGPWFLPFATRKYLSHQPPQPLTKSEHPHPPKPLLR